MKGTEMKRGSTMFLRATIILIGLIVIALCVFVLPAGIGSDSTGDYRPILLGLYIPAVPFFIALYQAMKLLDFIDMNQAFSDRSIAALKYIKYCAFIISALFTAGMPYVFQVADKDDAPGVILIGLVITGVSTVIAIFAGVLQALIQNAVDIKSENDLTV
jgi:hypothetical protein